VFLCAACAKSPKPETEREVHAPSAAATAAPARSPLQVEIEAVKVQVAGLESESDALQANVVKAESMVAEADDPPKRTAATAWIGEQAKLRNSTLAKLPGARARAAALRKAARGDDPTLSSATEAELNEASREGSRADDKLDTLERELGEQSTRLQAAESSLQAKQNDADRAAALQKLEQLKRESAASKKRP